MTRPGLVRYRRLGVVGRDAVEYGMVRYRRRGLVSRGVDGHGGESQAWHGVVR